MKPVVSIGNQDFMSIRKEHCFYVDKTPFIKEWWESKDVVTLITRPRRFGKTLNMSMVDTFFSNQHVDKGHLFEGLSIWQEQAYRDLQGAYPVIFLSFSGIKGKKFEDARMGIIQKLVKLYSTYYFVKDSDVLNEKDRAYFDSVDEHMDDAAAAVAINYMTDYLCRHYQKKVIILLDEYDAPLQEAYLSGYWDDMSAFIRSLFNATFKTNPCMERGILTGITRVSKESIFSDFNNLQVITTTSRQYAAAFGFTEQEVETALELFDLKDALDKVKFWYDGFQFGKERDIYNPWSITKYLDSGKLGTHWANTSSNSLVSKLIQESPPDTKIAMEDLLAGKSIETPIDEEIVFSRLDGNETAIWSLLLASGYLKVESAPENPDDYEGPNDTLYRLSLTNREVNWMFRSMFLDWFQKPRARYNDFIKALFLNDLRHMNQFMNRVTAETFSFFDTGNEPSSQEPERFFHGFVLGLIADSRLDYVITSNRESGFGRYDVMMEPKDKTKNAFVFEFKVHEPDCEKTLEDTVATALAQIEEKNYDSALLAQGIPKAQIRHYGFAFEGKNVLIGSKQYTAPAL